MHVCMYVSLDEPKMHAMEWGVDKYGFYLMIAPTSTQGATSICLSFGGREEEEEGKPDK